MQAGMLTPGEEDKARAVLLEIASGHDAQTRSAVLPNDAKIARVKCNAYAAPQALHLPAQSRGDERFQVRTLKYKLVSRDRSTIRLRSMSPSAAS